MESEGNAQCLEGKARLLVLRKPLRPGSLQRDPAIVDEEPQPMPQTPQQEAPADAGEAAEEQSEFNVVLKGFEDGKKIPVIKEVRAATGLGLKEAKELVEAGDRVVKEGISKEEATALKEKIEAAGGTVEVK